jgi:hypothetical protein
VILAWHAGEPVSIDNGVAKVGGQSNNVYTARIEFDNGATGLIQANRAAGGRVLRAELHGAGVSCFMKLNDELEVLQDGDASVRPAWEIDTSAHPQPSPSPATGAADTKPFDGELAMHAHFLDCVRSGGARSVYTQQNRVNPIYRTPNVCAMRGCVGRAYSLTFSL